MFEVTIPTNTTVPLSPTLSTTLLLYHTLITVLGLTGNTVVLYGTHRYHAMNIDSVSMVFVKFLAGTDLVITVLSCVPMWVAMVKGGWMLGDQLCLFLGYVVYIPGIAEVFIILEFTFCKLMLLKYPMATLGGLVTAHRLGLVFTATYLLAALQTCGTAVLSGGVHYIPEEYSCNVVRTHPDFRVYGALSVIFVSFLPPAFMMMINTALLWLAHKIQNSDTPGCRAIVMTIAISWIYILSVIPKGVFNIYLALNPTTKPPIWAAIFQKEVFFLNTVCNPLVYTAANLKFRSFVMRRLKRRASEVRTGIVEQLDDLRDYSNSRNSSRLNTSHC